MFDRDRHTDAEKEVIAEPLAHGTVLRSVDGNGEWVLAENAVDLDEKK